MKSDWPLVVHVIDGSHLFEDVFMDFYFVWHLLSDNGMEDLARLLAGESKLGKPTNSNSSSNSNSSIKNNK